MPDSNSSGELAAHPLFAGLSTSFTAAAAALCDLLSLEDGSFLFQAGDDSDAIYLVLEGRIRLLSTGHDTAPLFEFNPGQWLGEIGFLLDAPHAASARALAPSRLARLSRRAFNLLHTAYPSEIQQVAARMSCRWRRLHLESLLARSGLLAGIGSECLSDLLDGMTFRDLNTGEILVHAGSESSGLRVLLSGQLEACTPQAGGELLPIATHCRGDLLGVSGLFSGQPSPFTLRALRPARVAELSAEAFACVLGRHPAALIPALVQGALSTLKNPARQRRRISFCLQRPQSSAFERQQGDRFLLALTHALETHGRVFVARENQVPAEDASGGLFHEWLSHVEQRHDFLLWDCAGHNPNWLSTCARHCDAAVLLHDGRKSPPPAPDIPPGDPGPDDATLVLLGGQPHPGRARAWRQATSARWVFSVPEITSQNLDLLARLLTRRAVGVVLGGGFGRGLAHPGVLRAIQEHGIPIDGIGGASMGAVIAAQYALGRPYASILQDTASACRSSIGGLTLPLVALTTGERFSREVSRLLGDWDIEDLSVPFFCVSANLNRAEMCLHTDGPLTRAVLASTRAPGLFPPVVIDGELHVDGGVHDNVPSGVMRSLGHFRAVIAVDVSPPHEVWPVADYGFAFSGWNALWNRLRRRGPQPPTLPHLLLRTLEMGGIAHRQATATAADLYLRPPLASFHRLQFDAAHRMATIAYDWASRELDAWLQRGGLREALQ